MLCKLLLLLLSLLLSLLLLLLLWRRPSRWLMLVQCLNSTLAPRCSLAHDIYVQLL
jgi:hypothetical protein